MRARTPEPRLRRRRPLHRAVAGDDRGRGGCIGARNGPASVGAQVAPGAADTDGGGQGRRGEPGGAARRGGGAAGRGSRRAVMMSPARGARAHPQSFRPTFASAGRVRKTKKGVKQDREHMVASRLPIRPLAFRGTWLIQMRGGQRGGEPRARQASPLRPFRDRLDLHSNPLGQPGHRDGAPRRPVIPKVPGVHLVHGGKITHVHQKHGGLHHS